MTAGAEPDVLAGTGAGRRFLRGASLRGIVYTAGLVFGATVTPFVTRHLGSADWGRYVTVTSVLFIAVALTEGGLSSMGVREFSTEGERDRVGYMRALIGLRLVLSAVAAMAAIAFALLAGYGSAMVEGTAIGCIGLFFSNLQATLAVVLTARLRIGWLAVTDFLSQTVTAVAMIALVLVHAPLLPFYAATTVAALSALIVTAAVARGELTLWPAFDPGRWRSLASDSLVYAAATALGVVYFQIVVVAVDLLTTPVQTGYFGLGFRVLSIINGLPWLVVATAFPILSRAASNDSARLRYALGRLFEVGLLAGGVLSVCLVLGAPFIVTVVGGHKFPGSTDVLRILGAGVPATWLVATGAYALLSLETYRPLMAVNGLAVVLAIVLCLILVPADGARGGAIVTAALEVALAAGYSVILVRRSGTVTASPGRVLRMVAAFAAAFAVGLLVPAGALVQTLCALAVVAIAVPLLGLFPVDMLRALRPAAGD